MEKTIKLKLDLLEKDKETLRQTMTMSNKVLNEIAAYGFEHHICSKVSVHKATYYSIRSKYPKIPSSILQGIRDVACLLKKISGKEQRFVSAVNHCISKEIVAMPKAEAIGKNIIKVDPRYTSQKCSRCGHIHKGNRKGHSFRCLKCGFQIHADLNAARNIAFIGKTDIGRLTVTQPYIACNDTGVGILVEHSDNAQVFIDRG